MLVHCHKMTEFYMKVVLETIALLCMKADFAPYIVQLKCYLAI